MNDNDKGITDELINDILMNVKLMLPDKQVNDKLLILYIKMMCNNILVKTNRRIFIPELKYVVIDFVKDKFDVNTDDANLKSIMSMSEYDRSVNFGITEVLKNKLNLIAQKQLQDNESLINKYKLLYRT